MQGTDAPFAHITCNTASALEAQCEQHISRAGAAASVYPPPPRPWKEDESVSMQAKTKRCSQEDKEVTETLTSSDV